MRQHLGAPPQLDRTSDEPNVGGDGAGAHDVHHRFDGETNPVFERADLIGMDLSAAIDHRIGQRREAGTQEHVHVVEEQQFHGRIRLVWWTDNSSPVVIGVELVDDGSDRDDRAGRHILVLVPKNLHHLLLRVRTTFLCPRLDVLEVDGEHCVWHMEVVTADELVRGGRRRIPLDVHVPRSVVRLELGADDHAVADTHDELGQCHRTLVHCAGVIPVVAEVVLDDLLQVNLIIVDVNDGDDHQLVDLHDDVVVVYVLADELQVVHGTVDCLIEDRQELHRLPRGITPSDPQPCHREEPLEDFLGHVEHLERLDLVVDSPDHTELFHREWRAGA